MKTNAVHEEHKLKYETLDEELAQFKERKFDLLQMLLNYPAFLWRDFGIGCYYLPL